MRSPVNVDVEDKVVEKVYVYSPLPIALRMDVLPFVLMYATFGIAMMKEEGNGFVVAYAVVAFIHALTFFSSEWKFRSLQVLEKINLYLLLYL